MKWLIILTGLFGGIMVISALFIPAMFTSMPLEKANNFTKKVLPVYYLLSCASGVIGALFAGLSGGGLWTVFPSALVSLTSVLTRQILVSQINELDNQKTGNKNAAHLKFNKKHRLTALINSALLLMAGLTLAQWAWR